MIEKILRTAGACIAGGFIAIISLYVFAEIFSTSKGMMPVAFVASAGLGGFVAIMILRQLSPTSPAPKSLEENVEHQPDN